MPPADNKKLSPAPSQSVLTRTTWRWASKKRRCRSIFKLFKGYFLGHSDDFGRCGASHSQEQCRYLSCWHGLRRSKFMLHTNNPKIPSQSHTTPEAVSSQPKYAAGGEKPPSSCHHSNNSDIPSTVVLPVNHKILQQHFPFFFIIFFPTTKKAHGYFYLSPTMKIS